MKNTRILNGYVVVYRPEHPKAMKGGNWDGYVYEHIMVAEKSQDTTILPGEVVHHFDGNKSNNSPDNLVILRDSSHAKLHIWMDQNFIVPKPRYVIRKALGCVRCKVCEVPISHDQQFCSLEHSSQFQQRQNGVESDRPDRNTLLSLVDTMPMTKIGELYGVSDTAVRKWLKKFEIDIGSRHGYWTKRAFLKV